jgi:putative hemolysin
VSSVIFEISAIFVLLIANGVFAMSEIAVVTARKSRLEELANDGVSRAQTALDLANHPDPFLSTVQIGITLVGILAGAFGGRALTVWLAGQIQYVWLVAPYRNAVALGIVVLGITYFSVILGELVPKRLALRHPESIAMFMAPLMRLFLKIGSPLVHLFTFSTDIVFKLVGKRLGERASVSEEEITTLLRQGTKAGIFEESEQEMVEAVFHLDDMSARGLMTTRTQIIWLDATRLNGFTRSSQIAVIHGFRSAKAAWIMWSGSLRRRTF